MAAAALSRRGAALFAIFWLTLLGAAGFYVYEAVGYTIFAEPQPGTTWLNRRLWYFAHIMIALPILLIAPFQFIAALRRKRPAVHRWLGRVFLIFSILAGASAVYLGLTIVYEGSRLPLSLFGLVWIAFAAMAWICARRGDYASHRLFVIRSLAIAFAFVWIRLLYTFQDELFWFIAPGEVRDTTSEWTSFVLPLLVVEAWFSWWPALRRALRLPARTRPRIGFFARGA